MDIKELKIKADQIVDDIKNKGIYSKENTFIDYKLELNIATSKNEVEVFLMNFAKDILAFANKDGGLLFLGFQEDRNSGEIRDVGLDPNNLNVLQTIDLKALSDQFMKLFDSQINIDIQTFNIATRRFYYILIEKHTSILIPKNDFEEYKLKKGDVIYRSAGNNVKANEKTSEFNPFLESKVNEKNKVFMQIWSNLLPEVFDINPKEILIINPSLGKVYGYNSKNKVLSSTDIEIDNKVDGPINVILNAISAGEIGKISPNEGKPIYKLVGEIVVPNVITRNSTSMNTIHSEIKRKSMYKISTTHLKQVMFHLGWVTNKNFNINEPKDDDIVSTYSNFIWIEIFDSMKGTKKIVFSQEAVEPLLAIVKDSTLHIPILGLELKTK